MRTDKEDGRDPPGLRGGWTRKSEGEAARAFILSLKLSSDSPSHIVAQRVSKFETTARYMT